jgi:hypothetical protein
MPKGESVECVAMGTNWVACQTDANFIRVFSKEGIQKNIIAQSAQVVAMTGYENLMAIFYHSGLPIYDQQQIKCKIIDTNNFKTVYNDFVHVSRRAQLTWVGFSDEGMLISMDDKGIISGLSFKSEQWLPLIDLKQQFETKFDRIWIVGFMEHKLMYIELQADQIQPHEQLKSKYKIIDLKIPLIFTEKDPLSTEKKEKDLVDMEESYLRQHFIFEHERHRQEVWLPYKLFRGSNDNERFLSETILEQKELIEKKKSMDKSLIETIRLAILNDEQDKIFTYLELLNFTASIKIIVKLCNQLNQNMLAQKVSQFIEEKAEKEVLQKQYQHKPANPTFDSRQMQMMLNQKTKQISEVETTDLSRFAIKRDEGNTNVQSSLEQPQPSQIESTQQIISTTDT